MFSSPGGTAENRIQDRWAKLLFAATILAFAVFFLSETAAIRWANSDDVLYDSLYHRDDFWAKSWQLGVEQARFYMPVAYAPIAAFFFIENPILMGLARCALLLGQIAAMSWLVSIIVGSRAQSLRFFVVALLLLQVPLTYNSILSYPEIGLGFIFFASSSALLLSRTSLSRLFATIIIAGFVLACCMNEAFWFPSIVVTFFALRTRTSSRDVAWMSPAALGLYLVVYIAFRMAHPTRYQGTHLSFDIGAFIVTGARNILATLPGFELVINRYNFEPGPLFKSFNEIESILSRLSLCMLLTIACGIGSIFIQSRTRQDLSSEKTERFSVIIPAALAFAFIAPFCATQKYQIWAHTRQYPYVYALYAWMFVLLIAVQLWTRLQNRCYSTGKGAAFRTVSVILLSIASWAVFSSNRHVFNVLRLSPYPVKPDIAVVVRDSATAK